MTFSLPFHPSPRPGPRRCRLRGFPIAPSARARGTPRPHGRSGSGDDLDEGNQRGQEAAAVLFSLSLVVVVFSGLSEGARRLRRDVHRSGRARVRRRRRRRQPVRDPAGGGRGEAYHGRHVVLHEGGRERRGPFQHARPAELEGTVPGGHLRGRRVGAAVDLAATSAVVLTKGKKKKKSQQKKEGVDARERIGSESAKQENAKDGRREAVSH